MKQKKKICFAGFSDGELPDLQAAVATCNSLWESHFVADAPAALALMAGKPFDALVSSMAMPGKNGAQLLHEVREIHPHTMGFIVGEVTDQPLIIECVGGTHQFLRRPFEPAKLVKMLQRGLKLDRWLATDDLRKLMPKLRRMPSLPSTYFNLVKELDSYSATTQGIGSVIARDPAATGRLLQMCNSAAFALAEKVTDPVHAVALLGIDTVKSLVMSLQVFSQTDAARGSGISLELLWEHSLLVAKFARQITLKQTGDARLAGDAFTAGLMHDVGRIVLASNVPKEYAAVIAKARETGRPLHEVETEHFKVNHAEIGAYLLGLWGLPAEIVEAAGGHHAPGQTVYANEFSLLCAVHAANVFAHEFGGQTDGLSLPEIDHDYFQMIQIEDQLPVWRESCTGEEALELSDKIVVSGAPVSSPARAKAEPAAKTEASPVPAAEPAPKELPSSTIAALKLIPPANLPPLVKPLQPISAPASRFGSMWIIAIALFLAGASIFVWYFTSKSATSADSATSAAPAVAVAPEAEPTVSETNVSSAPVSPAPVPAARPAPAPTLAAKVVAAVMPKPASPFDRVHVQGVFFRSSSPLAIINGHTVGVGDSIKGIQVTDIGQHSVTLVYDGQQKVFKFN